ncbi:MAG: DUF1570 domain-containing protein [Phycisphaerales bacterium]|jgi:hypothetical protein|nr:DUF1570 domain-containing protein [Phycisphaerales bacterium]
MTALAIAVACATLGQQWYDTAPVYNTEHWVMRTDLAPNDAVEAGRLLDAVYEAYRNGLSMLPGKRNERMEAWVFLRKSDYNTTVQSRTRGDSGVVENSAGVFFTDSSGLQVTAVTVADAWKNFERTAKHEAFHQFAHTRFVNPLPQWVNEGLAEYFEHSGYINGAIVPGQVEERDLAILQQALQTGRYVPFLQMMRMSNQEWGQGLKGPGSTIQYLQAWSMVHFLIHGDDGKHVDQFDRFLLLMSEGMDDEEAFVKAFGTNDLQSFEQAWANHVSQLIPSSTMTAARRLSYMAMGMLELNRRGRSAVSLDELRAGLQTIDYRPTLTLQYEDVSFDPSDDTTFVIPADSFSHEQPAFVVKPGRPLPSLATEGLEPYNLRVRWTQHDGDISWTIDVGR